MGFCHQDGKHIPYAGGRLNMAGFGSGPGIQRGQQLTNLT